MAAAAVALGVIALGAGSAAASTAIRTDPGGGLLTGNTTITNTTADPSLFILTNLGSITCTQTNYDATVGVNQNFGSITGDLVGLTFTTCTDTIPLIAIPSCTRNPASSFPDIHIFASNDIGGTTTIDDPSIRCSIAGSTTSFCYYTAANAEGIGSNASSTLSFSGVGIVAIAGSGSLGAACGTTGLMNVVLRHIVQGGTNRTITVQTA